MTSEVVAALSLCARVQGVQIASTLQGVPPDSRDFPCHREEWFWSLSGRGQRQ
jgi:hypothetical protein